MDERAVFWKQFKALYVKRKQYSSRDRKTICCNTFLPVLLLLLGLSKCKTIHPRQVVVLYLSSVYIVLLKAFPLQTPPSLKLDLNQYKQPVNYVPFNSTEPVEIDFSSKFPNGVISVDARIEKGLNGSCPEQDGKEIFDSR